MGEFIMEHIENFVAGRMNRMNFIKYNILLFLALLVLVFPVSIFIGKAGVVFLALMAVPVEFYLYAKRFHDLGKSTAWSAAICAVSLILFLLPSGAIHSTLNGITSIAFICLCVIKGTDGTNEYGMVR